METPETEEWRELRFRAEYAALCRKLHVFIGGCGCCGSPFVDCIDRAPTWDSEIEEHLEHIRGT